ncbi:hypothetical protein ACJX0J_039062, partial [Zea mays]
ENFDRCYLYIRRVNDAQLDTKSPKSHKFCTGSYSLDPNFNSVDGLHCSIRNNVNFVDAYC